MTGALVLWLAALLGLLVHWGLTVAIGAAAVGIALVTLVRDGPARRPPGARVAWPVLVCGLLALWPVAPRIHDAATDPLREAAARGEVVELRAEIRERPRPVRTAGFGAMPAGVGSVVVPATVGDGSAVLLIAPVDQWSRLLPGQSVTMRGKLAPATSDELIVAVVRVRDPPLDVGPAPVWESVADSLRKGLRRASGVLDPEPAGLLPAVVVGDKDALSPTVVDEFRVAGLSHLLAVSGANLAVVCVAILMLLRALRVGPRGAAAGALAGLVGFVVLAGPEPSVLRAGVMGAVGLVALAVGRERSALPALGTAVVVLVAVDPGMATALGFVLSVLATGALVLLAPRWADALARRGVPRGVAEALAVPAAAHLVTAPVVAGVHGQVSLVAVLANLVAAPVVAPATVLGVLAAVVMPVWPWLAELLVRLAGPELSWVIAVGRHAADVPGAAIGWPSGWWGGLLLAVAVIGATLAWRFRRGRAAVALALVAVLVVVIPVRVLAPGWPPPGWAAVACDVGQGDATVLATAEPGRAVLVDTGPESGPVDDCLDRLGVDRIPVVILSHLHADHVGGLAGVLAGRSVGAVAVGAGRAPEWAWRQVRKEAAGVGVPLTELSVGTRLSWPGLDIEVLAANGKEVTDDDSGTAINNTSLVLRASTSAGRVLLTGDIELAAQADLLASGVDVSADVVKVPHHGSRTTSPEFLDAVGARIALVSVGARNRYGHPSPRTMTTLRDNGTQVVRTDTDGDSAVLPGPTARSRGSPSD
ncbi:DNA internalization-related competence protein ComEC/Rec2 [Alloactinosynnema sp. L-07]|uniref:DNA internalization-related competence protein ComEC/Rec2 n=1 Tax=Alloactinosynnema sp. L-07 TaxID=1653480 RepID=UPI0012FC7C8C|nr:DNA internalization-related competence protein ComEC/Rec2 [Alloactinosynnema sp. L-07]